MKTSTAADAKAKLAAPTVTITVPYSWTLKTWARDARDVWPFDGTKARHVLRVHQAKLVAAGALTRIGHEIVILGAGYAKWLASHTARVTEYTPTANLPEHAHKRHRLNQ